MNVFILFPSYCLAFCCNNFIKCDDSQEPYSLGLKFTFFFVYHNQLISLHSLKVANFTTFVMCKCLLVCLPDFEGLLDYQILKTRFYRFFPLVYVTFFSFAYGAILQVEGKKYVCFSDQFLFLSKLWKISHILYIAYY